VDLVVLGDCNPDVLVLGGDVTPAFGQQEKLVGSIDLVVGGSAAITAVTGMTVALSRGRDRAILTALGAMTSLTAADVPGTLLARARHVHVSSYFLLEDSLGPGLAGLLSTARAGGATTSLDTNWDPSGRWGDERLAAAIAQTDLLLPNEAEALRLSGAGSLDDAVSTLATVGRRLVVKLGERGVICADRSIRHEVSVPAVTPVDTTGAGDCFNAGLIAGLLQGLALPAAAALGCATGALSTGGLGGTASAPNLPTAARLAALASESSRRSAGSD
jgi:sugar/nucleoside kinase (ribokinase family)